MKQRDWLNVLFSDERIVAVEKPANLATIPGRGETDSLLEKLARQLGIPCRGTDDPRLRVVHRLDKGTSGVLLMARDIAAQRHLSHQFQNNQLRKEYLAIVFGKPEMDEGTIDAPLGPNPGSKDRMMVSKHGRASRTDWKVEKRMRRFTLVRCFPKTGRTHQIRVHLRSIGLPLAVDELYNSRAAGAAVGIFLSEFKRDYRPTAGQDERALISRLTLHAERLGFVHPDGREMVIECPLPKDFRAAITQLSKL